MGEKKTEHVVSKAGASSMFTRTTTSPWLFSDAGGWGSDDLVLQRKR